MEICPVEIGSVEDSVQKYKMTENNKNEKSLFKIQLENEAKAKEILDKEQIKELNRALIQGTDLNKAAKSIFGPGPDHKITQQKSNDKLKPKETIRFNKKWNE